MGTISEDPTKIGEENNERGELKPDFAAGDQVLMFLRRAPVLTTDLIKGMVDFSLQMGTTIAEWNS